MKQSGGALGVGLVLSLLLNLLLLGARLDPPSPAERPNPVQSGTLHPAVPRREAADQPLPPPVAPAGPRSADLAGLARDLRELKEAVARLEAGWPATSSGDRGSLPAASDVRQPEPVRAVESLVLEADRFEAWKARAQKAHQLQDYVSEERRRAFLNESFVAELGVQGRQRTALLSDLELAWGRLDAAQAEYRLKAQAEWRRVGGKWRKFELSEEFTRSFEREVEAAHALVARHLDPTRVTLHRRVMEDRGLESLFGAAGSAGLSWAQLAQETGVSQD